jgi:hypothetical protein
MTDHRGSFGSEILLMGVIEHSGEHYGQLVVYFRINGLTPPESRQQK